jgi:hypothetical protein
VDIAIASVTDAKLQSAGSKAAQTLYVPQMFIGSYVAGDLPPSLRAYDDDIAARPCLVGYINSHCTMWRDRVYHEILKLLGPDAVVARGKCGANARPVPKSVPVFEAMRDCRVVLAAGTLRRAAMSAATASFLTVHARVQKTFKASTAT